MNDVSASKGLSGDDLRGKCRQAIRRVRITLDTTSDQVATFALDVSGSASK